MFDSSSGTRAARRSFIQTGLAALCGLVAFGTTSRLIADSNISAAPSRPVSKQGYRETDHVRAYYRSVRF